VKVVVLLLKAERCCRRLPLATMKCKIVENLSELERLGVVSATDGYQQIVNSIAQVCSASACQQLTDIAFHKQCF